MNYRRLGAAGLKVSGIALGSWQSMGGCVVDRTAFAMMDRAWDLGVNLLDTADIYQEGRAEETIGRWMRGKAREEVLISTKCLRRMWAGPNGEGLSKKHILVAAEKSLRRLGTDYIDIYQFHWPHPETPIEESMEAMELLVRQGKVLYPGYSNYDIPDLVDAQKAARACRLRFASNQIRYTLFDRAFEQSLIPACGEEGLGILVWSPLEQGLLTDAHLSGQAPAGSRLEAEDLAETLLTPANLKAMAALAHIARARGATLAQLALAWLLRRPEVSSCIVGAYTPEELEEACSAAQMTLAETELRQIETILQSREKTLGAKKGAEHESSSTS